MEDERLKVGLKVSKNTIIGNSILSIIKVFCGIAGTSSAMIADGIHSLSDVFTTVGVIIGLKLSSKKADKGHPYGHERIESITALFLSVVLFLVAVGIGYSGIVNIITKQYAEPGILAVAAAVISIISKEAMYQYTIIYAKKINSTSLKADAWHHRSDSLSSIGALIGIVGARMGYLILDSIAAIVICIIIVKVSYDICRQSIDQLIDAAVSDDKINDITEKILATEGVIRIDNLRTRQYASKLYVDVDISIDSSITVEEGHSIAMNVHERVEEDLDVKHCMVHVNPYYPKYK